MGEGKEEYREHRRIANVHGTNIGSEIFYRAHAGWQVN